jgi:ABC-type antimicrobial peptide transport system permease subunit
LLVAGELIPAHKLILAARSPYFEWVNIQSDYNTLVSVRAWFNFAPGFAILNAVQFFAIHA